MGKQKEPEGRWEWVMFDSVTNVTHDVVCSCCRKPKRQLYNSYCSNCGAKIISSSDAE